MTIRKRLSRTNTRILLFALLSLLVIGVFIIEIFEKTYLEQAINYVKLQDHSVELVDFLDEYQFSEDEIGTLGKKIRSYGHNFYIAKDRQRVSTDFSTKQLREMQYLDSYVTINEPADVFVWRTATMIFKSYETETGTYQVVALRNDENTRQINPNRETYRWLIPIFTAIGVLAIVIIVGISRYFSRKLENRIMEPIEKLIDAATRVEDGNFEEHVEYEGEEEFEKLCHSFNTMQDSLAAGVDRAEEYDKAKTEMIAGMSHDLRTPLTSIKGYVEAILDGTIPPEMQEKYLKIVLFETERLHKLTQSLLTLNDIDDKGNMLDLTSFDINAVIKDTAASFEGTCTKKRISISLILASRTLYVCADMGKIQQVLYNLIDNAIKFSNNDSTITVETTEKHGKVFVSVKDTGCGIPKASITKIWERFYKLDASRGKDRKGTGLGLSIVKEIITAHNQNINVISTEGVGTEFIFTLAKGEAPK